jgi:cytochrome b pre-mRNA-processing protein 3
VLGWLGNILFSREEASPLYQAVVAHARQPHWYVEGAVPDTVDGRFDMVAGVLAMVLLRLEQDSAGAEPSARVTERFVEDMDGQLREIGVGDIVVGKHIGRMMQMLGGRLGAYREGLASGVLKPAIVRNVYRGTPPGEAAVAHVETALLRLHAALAALPLPAVIKGQLP